MMFYFLLGWGVCARLNSFSFLLRDCVRARGCSLALFILCGVGRMPAGVIGSGVSKKGGGIAFCRLVAVCFSSKSDWAFAFFFCMYLHCVQVSFGFRMVVAWVSNRGGEFNGTGSSPGVVLVSAGGRMMPAGVTGSGVSKTGGSGMAAFRMMFGICFSILKDWVFPF